MQAAEDHDGNGLAVREAEAPSIWARVRAGLGKFSDAFFDAFGEPRLSDRLPPIPLVRAAGVTRSGTVSREERGELLLLGILRAPHAYQLAALLVARRAIAVRGFGEDAYAELVVHFALSRMRPDEDGTIPITRVRETLPDASFLGTVLPALKRLEERGYVVLLPDPTDGEHGLFAPVARIELTSPL
jgi:hypothetical protein